jgi:hypothetical protein
MILFQDRREIHVDELIEALKKVDPSAVVTYSRDGGRNHRRITAVQEDELSTRVFFEAK